MTLENATLANISFSDTKITLKKGTAAEWTEANPVLAVGEPAFETDTGIMKIGDGVTAYNSLDYVGTESFSGSEIDTLLNTVDRSNISATHKITRSATIVVAASDSSAKSKAQADYVCDGVTDGATIQAALNSCHALTNAWEWYSDTPVMAFGDYGLNWFDGTTHHTYYAYDDFTKIGHATSLDGIVWTDDTANNPVLSCGAAGSWDDTSVAVFMPWVEDGTWYALYRGNSIAIGLATSPDGITWTKHGTNPVAQITGCCDPAGLIKVDDTYYVYTNTTGGDRELNVITSTNLIDWVKPFNTPIMNGKRYCTCVFKYNSKYYLIVSHHYNNDKGGALELYESVSPLFHPNNTLFKGVVVFNLNERIDTPIVVTNTIQRDTFPDNKLYCYFSMRYQGGPQYLYLTLQDDIQAAINSAIIPKCGTVVLADGTYVLNPLYNYSAIEVDYGNHLIGKGAILRLKDGYSIAHTSIGAVNVLADSTLSDCVLNGNAANCTSSQKGLTVSTGGTANNVTVKNWREIGIYSHGYLNQCVAIENISTGIVVYTGEARNCRSKLNTSHGITTNYASKLYSCMSTYNGGVGISLNEGSSATNCSAQNNTGVNLLAGVSAKLMLCEGIGGTTWGLSMSGANSIADNCILYGNRTAELRGQAWLSGEGSSLINSKLYDGLGIHNYAMRISGTNCKVINNNLTAGTVGTIYTSGSTTPTIKNNTGYITESTGTATITTGQTTVAVNHGLAAAPTRVLLSPTTATAGKQYYVSAKAASTFTITINSAADEEISFDWQAVI